MPELQHIVHPLKPFCPTGARILILGSFPSVKTREMGFFYGHPQNRFWRVMAALYQEDFPETVEDRKAFLTRNRIALYDSIYACDIRGSSDASIRNVEPSQLQTILDAAPIEAIYCNGKTSGKVYKKYQEPLLQREATTLPSTSPANAQWSLDRLIEDWRVILP